MSPESRPSRWQRERRGIHILYIVLGAAIIFSLGIVGYGYYSEKQEDYELHHRPALRVNGTVLNIDDFTEGLGRSGIQGAKDIQQMNLILESTIIQMQQEELIQQAMDRYDISPPTKKEVDEEIREMVGEENYKKAVKNKDLQRMTESTLRQWKLRDYLGEDKILPQQQAHVQGIWVGTKGEAEEVISRLKGEEDFVHVVSELSLDPSRENGGDLGWRGEDYEFFKAVFSLKQGEITPPLSSSKDGYWVLKAEDKKARVSGILLGTKQEAEEVIKRIEGGEEFSDLASELSLDSSKDNRGDLGWRGEDYEFFKAVFSFKQGEITPPLSSSEDGYWVLKAEDRAVYVLGILLGTKQEAEEVILRLRGKEDFVHLASKLSRDEGSKDKGGDMGWLPWGIWGDEFDKAVFDTLGIGEVSGPLFCTDFAGAPEYTQGGYWVLKGEDKMAHVSGILLRTKQEAEEVIKKIEEGEEFSDLASELSLDSSRDNGGNLEWKGEDYEFFDDISTLNHHALSEPVFDSGCSKLGGYWVVEVLEREEERELEHDMQEVIKGRTINEWMAKEREEATLEVYLDDELIYFAMENL